MLRVLHPDFVNRLSAPVADLESVPRSGDDRIDPHPPAPDFQSEDLLDPCPVHPPRGARIPGPSAPAGLPFRMVDIRGGGVRFQPEAPDRFRIPRAFDRI